MNLLRRAMLGFVLLTAIMLTASMLPALAQEAPPTFTPYPTYTPFPPLPTYTPYPTYTPLPTYTPFPTVTVPPSNTPTATLTLTSTVAPSPTSSIPPYDVLANCEEFNQTGGVAAADVPIRIFWGWVVTEPQYITQQLEYAIYDVRLDNTPLTNYDDFRGPLQWYPNDGGWGVYWYVPMGFLQPGEHRVSYSITWSQAVDDGWVHFGPGTLTESITSGCTFTVQ